MVGTDRMVAGGGGNGGGEGGGMCKLCLWRAVAEKARVIGKWSLYMDPVVVKEGLQPAT